LMRKSAVHVRTTEGSSFISRLSHPPLLLWLFFDESALVGISIDYAAARRPKDRGNLTEKPLPRLLEAELNRYFETGVLDLTWPARFESGTPFEQSVWKAARSIPAGETRSYGWLAEKIGRPRAARAVGQALARNPLPVVFPCHRVIRSDGGLGGFYSGTRAKKYLLELERRNTARSIADPDPPVGSNSGRKVRE